MWLLEIESLRAFAFGLELTHWVAVRSGNHVILNPDVASGSSNKSTDELSDEDEPDGLVGEVLELGEFVLWF